MEVQSAPLDVLSPEQRDAIDQYLSNPIKFPSEFKQWIVDNIAVNLPDIPVSQLLGYKPTLAQNAIINDEIDVDSTDGDEGVWHDFGFLGPKIEGLADGTYFVAYGCKTGRSGGGGCTTRYGPGVNGADPVGFNYATFVTTDPDAMIWKSSLVSVRGRDNNNILTAMYWYSGGGGFQAQFLHRWLTAIRVT